MQLVVEELDINKLPGDIQLPTYDYQAQPTQLKHEEAPNHTLVESYKLFDFIASGLGSRLSSRLRAVCGRWKPDSSLPISFMFRDDVLARSAALNNT